MRIRVHIEDQQDQPVHKGYSHQIKVKDLLVRDRVRVNQDLTGYVVAVDLKLNEVCVRHDDEEVGLYIYNDETTFEIEDTRPITFSDIPVGSIFRLQGGAVEYIKTTATAAREVAGGMSAIILVNSYVVLMTATYTFEETP